MSMNLAPVLHRIRETTLPGRAALVALSGIDGCGKGFVTKQLAASLEADGLRVAPLNIDGWLNLPPLRFSETEPARHFYENAIRFDELFAQLVLPLRDRRSIRLEADHTDETATAYRKQLYAFDNIDVILLEGIYLLRRDLVRHYDLSVWIDCTFETALERAIGRAQEGLPPEATTEAYHRIYFPAQKIHFQLDCPREAATLILPNDPRIA